MVFHRGGLDIEGGTTVHEFPVKIWLGLMHGWPYFFRIISLHKLYEPLPWFVIHYIMIYNIMYMHMCV